VGVPPRRDPTTRDCNRALWLLGLEPPVTSAEVTAAYRERVARTHPDRHAGTAAKEAAAATLTRALNDARATLETWIASENDWPGRAGATAVRFGEEPEPWPERAPAEEAAAVCRRTGLRAGDLVRIWPYDDEPVTVTGTDVDGPDEPVWVRLDDRSGVRADRVRLAAYQCPVCGDCAGPAVDAPNVRPCPPCLVDLRRLEQSAADAPRIRRAIEARATAGLATADAIGDDRLVDRARERRRWARRLVEAGPDDLHAALLAAFGRAFERWGARVVA